MNRLAPVVLFLYGAVVSAAELNIEITGLNQQRGEVFINVFANEEGYPDQPDRALSRHRLEFAEGRATLQLNDLKQGQYYALSVCHDENSNGRCDTNFLGIPSEGVGVSNNARGSFGPPKFRDARFIMQNITRQEITLRY